MPTGTSTPFLTLSFPSFFNNVIIGCYDHMVVDNVNHFDLSNNQQVLDKIYSVVSNPPNVQCSSTTSSASAIVVSLMAFVFPLLVYFY
jgi:hypothetical protein